MFRWGNTYLQILLHSFVLIGLSASTPLWLAGGSPPILQRWEDLNATSPANKPMIDPESLRCYGTQTGRGVATLDICHPLLEWIIGDLPTVPTPYKGQKVMQAKGCDCIATLQGPDDKHELDLKSTDIIIMLGQLIRMCQVRRPFLIFIKLTPFL